MDLSKVMAISGKSGLFKIVSQSRGSIIVESLVDGKKMPVFATHRSSILEDISMFTNTDDVPLKEVLWKIYQKEGGKSLSIDMRGSADQLKEYFETILPDYDEERVYASDIRKLFTWYNLLLGHDMISEPESEESEKKAAEDESAPDQSAGEAETPETPEKAAPKKAAAKKTQKGDKPNS